MPSKTVLLTRSIEQIKQVEKEFLENDFNLISFPVIKITPLDFNIRNLENYDWIIFTSTNSVKYFFEKINNLPQRIKIATVGNKTTEEIKKYNYNVDILPKEFVAESLIKEFQKINIINKNILFPRALKGRDIIIEELAKIGAKIDLIPIYKNEINIPENKKEVLNMLKNSEIDYIIFTSPSTVRNFFKIIDINIIKDINYICIGPITQKELLNYTDKNYHIADEFSINGIINKLLSLS